MIQLVEMCLCVCQHDNLKTVADICCLLSSYVDWRKIWDEILISQVEVICRRV